MTKAKVGFWVTEWLWELYLQRKDSPVPAMRRYALTQKTKALITCDRILNGRDIYVAD